MLSFNLLKNKGELITFNSALQEDTILSPINGKYLRVDLSNEVGLVWEDITVTTFDSQPSDYYLDRSNHTGLQSIDTIYGISTVARTNNYYDLDNLPSLVDSITLDGKEASYYLNRDNHFGSIKLEEIDGLATVCFTGNYNDLVGQPELGSAYFYNVGTNPGNVVQLDNEGKLPSIDGSNLINLPTVVINYNDLVDRPSLFSGDYNALTNKPILFSGNYNDLIDKPTLCTASSLNIGTNPFNLVQLDSEGKLPVIDGSQLTNLPTGFSGNYEDLNNKPVLFSGDYNNLTNKPSLFSGNYIDLSNKPLLTTVATSGNYNDLSNKPVEFYQSFTTTKTANYTIQQSDHGMWIPCDTNNLTITFPSNLSNGTQVVIDRQGTATVSFAVTGGATLVGKSTAIANQYGVVHAVYNSTENYWRLTGDL